MNFCSNVQDDQERRTTKKRNGWKCMPYIIGNESFEKVATTGLTANFTVYLVSKFHMQQVSAANFAQIFFGTTNFAPLVGAFISDAYLGRFRTLAFSSVASFLGMVLLTLAVSLPNLRPATCSQEAENSDECPAATTTQMLVLLLTLALLVVGAGGIRPCSLPFGVDQFDTSSESEKKGLNSFFNWYYCTSSAAFMIGLTVVVYIQDSVSWSIGFAIPTFFMLISIIFFFLGARMYFHVPPEGSVFSGIAQVFAAAYRKKELELPEFAGDLYNPPSKSELIAKLSLTRQFEWLNKAAIVVDGDVDTVSGRAVNPWRLASVQMVEEVKCLVRIVPICVSGVVCFVAVSQQWTFVVLQAMNMDRRLWRSFEIPAGTLASFALLALALFIPIYDKLIVPAARRLTGHENGITLLQRQGIGLVISIFSMVVAGLVESRRRRSFRSTPALSAMWLMPQLVLMGVAEAFNAVGQIEFYNRQFPEHMQTLAGSVFFCSLAGASYLSSFLVMMVKKLTRHGNGGKSWLENNINEGRVDLFYYTIAAMGVVNLVYFVFCARHYRYKGQQDQKPLELQVKNDEEVEGGGKVNEMSHI